MKGQKLPKKKTTPHPGYSEACKRQIVAEFEQGLINKASLKRKYGILGHSSIDKWLDKYGKFDYSRNKTIGRTMKDPLQQRIKELEKALEIKEKEVKAFNKFIEVAERELDIKIVKKSGTKQSKR
tara:strand:- start:762 stop:1136 length:375 start_codon:yes stop_codon:yes gene_type:complete